MIELIISKIGDRNIMMNQMFVVHREELILRRIILRKTFKKVRHDLRVLFRKLIKKLSSLMEFALVNSVSIHIH